MAELLEKEQAYRDKYGEAGDKEMVSEVVIIKKAETVAEYSEHIKG